MNQIISSISSIFKPLQSLYNRAFNANKYAAGIGLSVIITTALFFVMVVLISLGDSGMKEDKSVKLTDVVMPERQIDVSIAKPKANFKAGGSFFRDGEYIPLFKVQPIYPRRAQERGTQGYAIVTMTITASGTVVDAEPLEGYCGDPTNPETEFRPCTIFNSASTRAAQKLKYKPKIVDGKSVPVEGVLHRFTFIMEQE
jgi:protein TonB